MKPVTGPDIADKLKSLCEGHGVTVKQMERDIGLSNGYMRKLAVQKSVPSADRLQRIADYFGVSVRMSKFVW